MVKEILFTLRMGANDPQCLKKLLHHAGRAGYSRVILELDRGIRYTSVPEVSAPWAWDKRTVEEIIAEAQHSGLEIVPLVPSFSHAGYLLENAPEFMEPDSKMYCPFSGVIEKRLFPILEEVIEIFHPARLHIGHDELISSYYAPARRTVFNCPECRKKTPAEILLYEINLINKFLTDRQIEVSMWADSLLDPECFKAWSFNLSGCYGGAPDHFEAMLPLLPRNIKLYDWHYEAARDFPTTAFLKAHGFRVAACCAHELNGFIFGRQAKKAGAESLLATLWHQITPENFAGMRYKLRRIAGAFDGHCKMAANENQIEVLLKQSNKIAPGRSREIFSFNREFSGILRCQNWSELRFTEFPDGCDQQLRFPAKPAALEIKSGRKGWINYCFKVSENSRVSAVLKLWMENPGHNAVVLEHSGSQTLLTHDCCCRGNRVKLPELTGDFVLRFEAENCKGGRQKFLRRFELLLSCEKSE